MVRLNSTFVNNYQQLTEGCGLLDVSERGKLMLTGSGAKEFLQGQVSNDIERLTPGTGCYAAFLTPKGKMLGDLRVLCTEDALLLDTERVALQELFNMIRRFSVGYDVELHKRTLQAGLLSLIGPRSPAVLGEDAAARLSDAEEHAHVMLTLDGIAARAIRTDVGADVLCEAADTDALRTALGAAGAVGVERDAVETLRIERGRPRYGVDIVDGVIPQEAGLNERAVSFTKGCYVGQETVARLHYRGKPNRQLRGLRFDRPVDAGVQLNLDGRVVGAVTSAAVSPRLGAIGLALVRREAPPGSVVRVQPPSAPPDDDGRSDDGPVAATVIELPFPG